MSKQNRYLVILPARMGAQRLPGKPLRLLGGVPIIRRTYSGVKDLFEQVYVATDSDDILAECESQKIPCIRTGSHHVNGTTRTLEAFLSLDLEVDYIINVQGDEAFISKEILQPLLDLLEEKQPEAATIQAPLPAHSSNSNVYVVTDNHHRALYFSRTVLMTRSNWPLSDLKNAVGRTMLWLSPEAASSCSKRSFSRWKARRGFCTQIADIRTNCPTPRSCAISRTSE